MRNFSINASDQGYIVHEIKVKNYVPIIKPIRQKLYKSLREASGLTDEQKESEILDNLAKAKIWIHNKCQKEGIKNYMINLKEFNNG